MRKLLLTTLLAASVAGCGDASLAFGDATSIIAVMDPALWDEVSTDVHEALEPTIRTVRDEKTFQVTYQNPAEEEWANLRRFRQMLLVGTGQEPWMEEALSEARAPVEPGEIGRAYNVWAQGQQVTLVRLSEAGAADELRGHLAAIHDTLDHQYRNWARNRMYMTGVDSALADTLAASAGFQLLLPEVYRWGFEDSTYVFRNDNPDPSELIRQIGVTWKSPIPPDMQPEGILEWRARIVEEYYENGQILNLEDAQAGPFEFRGRDAYEIQAVWNNPPELNWPAAGPFITRAVICPGQDRMYLLDAWLYAPDRKKYQYMIQLKTILDTFRCGL